MDEAKRMNSAADCEAARAAEDLVAIVYGELRRLAEHRIAAEAPGHTLQPTALVHEAYLRILDTAGVGLPWKNEAHFFGAAAEAMRRILIDRARAKGAQKRGGDRARVAMELEKITLATVPEEILDLDEALLRLAEEEPGKAELVKLRFFAGLSLRQAAAVLGISSSTADRRWAYARAWLFKELQRDT